jgi:peptidoglycan biosynthesis protein MviN/MurJ (putative lipid II flippase)
VRRDIAHLVYLKYLIKPAIAGAVMSAVLIVLHRPLQWWLESGVFDRVTWLAVTILLGAAAYFAALIALGMRTADFRLMQD